MTFITSPRKLGVNSDIDCANFEGKSMMEGPWMTKGRSLRSGIANTGMLNSRALIEENDFRFEEKVSIRFKALLLFTDSEEDYPDLFWI